MTFEEAMNELRRQKKAKSIGEQASKFLNDFDKDLGVYQMDFAETEERVVAKALKDQLDDVLDRAEEFGRKGYNGLSS